MRGELIVFIGIDVCLQKAIVNTFLNTQYSLLVLREVPGI
jgi:hypothetical protein